MIPDRRYRIRVGALALVLLASSLGLAPFSTAGAFARANSLEGPDNDGSDNDDFSCAQEIANDTFLDGTTGLGDAHRIDIYVLKNVPAGKVINASLQVTNFNGPPYNQAIQLEGWNKFHMEHLAWSNREDQPVRRPWEAISFLCVVTGDYYISLKPIAGAGTMNYTLHVRSFDPPDITAKIGIGGNFGTTIPGQVSSEKWYPLQWYKFQLDGENNGFNQFFYANLTIPGAPDERLLADLYVRNLEPETFTYWLNHSWWLDSFVQYEEAHAAACGPGKNWYYLTVQAYNSTDRSENFELRTTTTLLESDGDNNPRTATAVTCSGGNLTVRETGFVARGPDMFDWYKAYLHKGDDLRANLTLLEKSLAIFRLSIYRDNLTSAYPEPGYDLMSSWTNKPAETVLNRVSALTTDVMQEGWYYIGVIAQIGLVPSNVSLLADWLLQSAWARYQLDITMPDHTSAPFVSNPLSEVSMDEDTAFSNLRLLDDGQNGGLFSNMDLSKEWGDKLNFTATSDPQLSVSIGEDAESTVALSTGENWNGDAAVTFTAADLYGHRASHRVTVHVVPTNDAPNVKARLPDFSVTEGATNATMTGIDLYACFSDPDLSPFGDDSLVFTIDNGSFPAVISGNRLSFGEAPDYPGCENTTVTVAVAAADRASLTVSDTLVITVIDREPGGPGHEPEMPRFDAGNASFVLEEGMPYVLDLNELFSDPQGLPLEFAYLGGASPDIAVELKPNGTVSLTIPPTHASSVETLRFQATSSSGKSVTGEISLRIINQNLPPAFVPGSIVPDPSVEIRVSEGRPASFGFNATDPDSGPAALSCRWYVDDIRAVNATGWTYTWTPSYEQSGLHVVKAELNDGLAIVQVRWSLFVVDVNRRPVITSSWHDALTAARPGSIVTFGAMASDPDGDQLEFTWSLPNGTILKIDLALTSTCRVVASGENLTLLLRVSDGKGGEATCTLTVAVEKTSIKPPIPATDVGPNLCPIAVILAVVAAGSIAAVFFLRRKR